MAFARMGHDAWSCDLLPTEFPGQHIRGDVLDVLGGGWDMMIAHPPCTYLATSGSAYFKDRVIEQCEAIAFVRLLMAAPIPRVCVENPISVIASRIRPCDQLIQPWQFGHGERKATCLWLKDLPKLRPTKVVAGRAEKNRWHSPGPDRWKNRSRTYPGIAYAMAEQWGRL